MRPRTGGLWYNHGMATPPEVLLVEDDRVMRLSFAAILAAEGFAVREAKDGESGVAAFLERRPDVVLLDLMMPGMDSLAACREIRKHDAAVPIVFLTCVSSETKQLRAYDDGADDYVLKSANPDLIVAKVRAAARRSAAMAKPDASGEWLKLGAVEVDLKSLEVFYSGVLSERLTRTERDILRVLASRRGKILSRDDLIAALRGEGFACEDSLVYSHVSRLRKKLGPAAGMLMNSRAAGYSLLA